MEYTNWDLLIIVLYQNSLEINITTIMRRDINTMDSISIKNLLSDVSNSMVLETIKTQNGLSDCTNWDVIEMRLLLNDNLYKNFKSTRTDFDNNGFDLGYFIYETFINLSADDIDNVQTHVSANILYTEEVILNKEQLIITQTDPISSGTTTTETSDGKNIKIGENALSKNKKGIDNVAIGPNSLTNNVSSGNVGIGKGSLATNKEGSNNTAIGRYSIAGITRGTGNVGLGFNAGKVTSKGQNNNESNQSTFLGSNSRPLKDKSENEIVIGADSVGNGSNTTTIGNEKTKEVHIHGIINSDGYKSSDGSIGVTTTFKTIDGLTINVKDGLIVSIK